MPLTSIDTLTASLPLFEETDAQLDNVDSLDGMIREFRALVARGLVTPADRAELGLTIRTVAELVADFGARIESGE